MNNQDPEELQIEYSNQEIMFLRDVLESLVRIEFDNYKKEIE